LRLISHLTVLLRLPALDRIVLRSDTGPNCSSDRSKCGQNSKIYLTVCLGYPQEQPGAMSGTFCSARNALNPIFSVRSCIASEDSAFCSLSCSCRSVKILSLFCAVTLLSGGILSLCLVHLLAHWRYMVFLIWLRDVASCSW
jgi:hypothetical protein